ncbi:hypothetical protein [Herbidospora cretacea]|uniref:hypothetical protein n=1 Tax=Herbidospora cretacea TaxID=28444 RepID=UPI0004C2EF35|nr:hypothetical protein [Herbidospora cretacea]
MVGRAWFSEDEWSDQGGIDVSEVVEDPLFVPADLGVAAALVHEVAQCVQQGAGEAESIDDEHRGGAG